ncbi:glucose PTS transporter transcription antiterminator GlcT [Virgibacillus alimentarius]|uniref:Transcriptional antiterminator n=1 Tax=Virgibacillus alimentarius TaxID=698769 RepID=A0ABS4SBW1_9BACI|nr:MULTISPECIES: PRD domain-containing protein [Virgibacillus]MBP2258985.1 transcriptional antiterminator [Virgibacillus alimentarius]HLR68130.1 transcription antiterminator [Virgibacillus sp.]
MDTFIVKKVLNNNVLIAKDRAEEEVVLIGKGIGFHTKKNAFIHEEDVEKLFVLRNQSEQEHYKRLLPDMDEKILQAIIDSLDIIRRKSNVSLHEQVHVALTDHLLFAINRLLKGMEMKNPFLTETKALYPFEYEIAAEVVDFINQTLDIDLPAGEVGFIALHVHSAITRMGVSDINKYARLVTTLVGTIEAELSIKIDPDSIHYIRLIRHIRYTIDRVVKDEHVDEPAKIAILLKQEYPICYNLAWKLIKIMQQTLKRPVYDAEAVYLTMHLVRLTSKYE